MPSPVFSKGGTVRCYCNLPRCVTMGYMCKSILGACFTRNTPTPTHAYSQARKVYHRYAPMHGCVELLSMGRHAECLRKGEVHSMETRETPVPVIQLHPDPDLTCCNQDMCNYRNINVYVQVDGNYDSQTGYRRALSENSFVSWGNF
nr:BMP and activin membrane-bound inhibitor homolog [Cherax quadricarinatus]